MIPDMYILDISGGHGQKEACLLLHGFPAATFTDPAHEKNQDIGKNIAEAAGFDVVLPHYRGLGRSKGAFSFLQSIKDSKKLAESLQERYNRIHIVGHSWGGLVAMNVAHHLTAGIGRVVLLSPFTDIPNAAVMKKVLTMVSADTKIKYVSGSIDDAVNELMLVKSDYNPRKIAACCSGASFFIIQSSSDDEVPVESTRSFVGCFQSKPGYLEFDSDHKFSRNRTELRNLVVNFIRSEPPC